MTEVRPVLPAGGIDRADGLRQDEALLASAWAAPGTRVLLVGAGEVALRAGPVPAVATVGPDDAPAGERLFLGLDPDGVAYWAVGLEGPPPAPRGTLRSVAGLGERDTALLLQATALANWHARHRHCPRCGAPTTSERGGHSRRCTADGSVHFPRTDPVVIMQVTDGGDRCVLGRQASWPARRYSCLAGFVDPGETVEEAVARETAEEVGLAVGAVRYVASQPWPFPANLMLGCTAIVTGRQDGAPGDGLTVDRRELEDARWVTRAELRAAFAAAAAGTADAGGDPSGGALLLPPPAAIAHRLLAAWAAAGA